MAKPEEKEEPDDNRIQRVVKGGALSPIISRSPMPADPEIRRRIIEASGVPLSKRSLRDIKISGLDLLLDSSKTLLEAEKQDHLLKIGNLVFGNALARELVELGRSEAMNEISYSSHQSKDYAKEISLPFLKDDISFGQVKSIFLNELSKAIESTAEAISTDQNVRKDFSDKAMRFVESYLFDLNEANPPPIPETKFTPRQDEIVSFLRNVWGEWNERDLLNRQILSDHDPKALTALVNWLNQDVEPKNTLPDDLKVYTKKEMTERWLEKFYFARDEVRRAASALNNRRHRAP